MLISVIIWAYRRRKYILEAIESVLNQTLDRKFYEIVVIKNFKEDQMDNFINKKCEKNLYSENPVQGAMIREALFYSKGDVICLLDDDDIFKKEKLEYVFNLFSSNSDLIYYHHGSILIDEAGNILSTKPISDPDHNSSSIAVRKDLFINMEWIDKIDCCFDCVLYYCAIDSSKRILSNEEKLSYYRVRSLVHGDMGELVESTRVYSQKISNVLIFIRSKMRTDDAKKYVDSYLNSIKCTYFPMFVLQGTDEKVTIRMIANFLLTKRFQGQRIDLSRIVRTVGDIISLIPVSKIKRKILSFFFRTIYTHIGKLSEQH